eukprot:maker-scaffold81_size397536-snap-gene-2.18 protein:Tk08533 transcript:maker-scaffold81_size397536-snap-gene-2.18-mRNA-1 annotation:"multidrug resistance-associated protein 1 isoform x4"
MPTSERVENVIETSGQDVGHPLGGLMKFCHDPFWDLNTTWFTLDPDFTHCFHQTALVYVPCGLLWLLAPLEIYWINASQSRHIRWNLINVAKCISIALCIILDVISLSLSLGYFGNNTSWLSLSDILAPLIVFLTHALALILTLMNKKMGLTSSGILFTFWFVLVITSGLTFASVVRFGAFRTITSSWSVEQSMIYTIYFPLVVAISFLTFWADPPPVYWEVEDQVDVPSPEMYASFPSKIAFGWIDTLIKMGWQTPLNQRNIFDLNPNLTTNILTKKWAKHEKKVRHPMRGTLKTDLIQTLARCFGVDFLIASGLQILGVLINQVFFVCCKAVPQTISLLITFSTSDEPLWRGYLYMSLLVAINMIRTLLNTQYFFIYLVLGQNVRTTLISAIYRKTFKLSASSRRQRSVGETVNLMSIDTERMNIVVGSLNNLWYAPLVILLSLYFLWGYLGPSCLAGLGMMIILIPINAWLSSRIKKYQFANMKKKDQRLETMNEVLEGIKVMKLYAWEPSFQEKIAAIRDSEVETLKKISYLGALQTFIFNSAVFLVTLVTFGTYVYLDPSNVLDAEKAFVSISYFNLMRGPLNQFPQFIIQLIQASVSHKRLDEFLNAPETDSKIIGNEPNSQHAVEVFNGSFAWDDTEDSSTIHGINLKIERGSLVAIVGQVGAGKSSLISAILGDMEKRTGSVNVDGTVAYVPQQAWIQNDTVRQNILFGRDHFPNIYFETVRACALVEDFTILEQGDQTEIGEKGINLSGGQKQRVSLARAVYNNRDIYLLDDPMSAVDAHVGKHIFEHVISSRTGVLKDKTRLLVTHNVTFLHETDLILVMKNGRISEMGTFNDLMSGGGDFSLFLAEYGNISEQDAGSVEQVETFQDTLDMVSNLSQNELNKTPPDPSSPAFLDLNSPLGSTIGSVKIRKRNSAKTFRKRKGKVGPSSSNKTNSREKGKLVVEEKLETSAVSNAVYVYYAKAIGLFVTITIFGLYAVNQAFSVGTNVWLAKWSDDPQSAIPKYRDMYLGGYGGLGGASALTVMVVYLIITIGGLNASTKLHNNLLAKILAAPMSFFDTNPKGRILNRFGKDVDAVDTNVPSNFNSICRLLFNTFGTIVVICATNPLFIVVFIPLFLAYWFIQKLYITTSRQLKRLNSIARSPIYSLFGETLSGVPTIKAFNLQDQLIKINESKVDTLQTTTYLNQAANRWLSVRLEMLGNVVILFAALFAVLGRDKVDPGEVGLSLSYATQITTFLTFLIRMMSMIENNMVSVERIQEYEDHVDQEAPYVCPMESTLEKQWPPRGAIRFQDYKTRYRPGLDLVLKGITCDIHAGEKIGIVGRTGAGKSSLTMALFRLIEPSSGTIYIDGTDITTLGLGFLRSNITIIPQDPVLFSGTMRLNLDPFEIATDDQIWRALKLGHLSEYVSGLRYGLDQEISEGGGNLSVGQRQLVCLARALLRKTQILVLDEATAAVDLEMDDLIQTTIRQEFKDCTILTIAHRLNTIMDCDRVIVLRSGLIAEMDEPQKLLQDTNSIFFGMAKNAGLMSEQEAKRQRVSDLLDAELDPKRISEIVGVSERTVRNIRAAKKIGNGVERKEGSGGNGLKRNEAFLKSLEAKIKADPTASMLCLADEFDVDEITIRRAVHDDLGFTSYVRTPRHLLTDRMKATRLERCKKVLNFLKSNPATRPQLQSSHWP